MDEDAITKAYTRKQKLYARANRIRTWELFKTKFFWIGAIVAIAIFILFGIAIRSSALAFSQTYQTFFSGSNYTKFQNSLVSSPKLMAQWVSVSVILDMVVVFFSPILVAGASLLFLGLYVSMWARVPQKTELKLAIRIAKKLSAEGYSDKEIKQLLGI